jgi:hypothetical protein
MQNVKGAWCKPRKVFLVVVKKGLSSRCKNVIRAQFKRRGRSARVAVRVTKTWWERGGRSKNMQRTYQERKKNVVMQKMPILTTSSLRSLKKIQDAAWSSCSVKGALYMLLAVCLFQLQVNFICTWT